MEYFAGLDVAMEETAICVIDREGKVVLETMVTTDPDAIVKVLKPYLSKLRRAGHEAGSLSPWLQVELKQRGVPAICLEAWHARAALSAMRNKTDKADARGIAHIMRAGWFREVHVKSEESYRLRLLLTQRRNLKRKFLDIENAIRHSIKTFGLRIGRVGRGQFEARVRELVADDPLVAGLTDCMLRARAALWQWSRSCVATSCAGASCAFPVSVRSAPWHSRQRSTIRIGSAIRRRSEPILG